MKECGADRWGCPHGAGTLPRSSAATALAAVLGLAPEHAEVTDGSAVAIDPSYLHV
jgi:hypothetical protein